MDERPGSAGKPSPLARVILVDDYDREVPVGEPGEICVRSPTVFLGYWGRDEDTAYTFRNGWHHTGDIGRSDEQGYLWYVKRKAEKELIKPGGENVYPAEVERTILEHGAVAEVCVIGVPDPRWAEAIKAVCVLKPGRQVEPQEIIDFVASRIARYKKPKHVVFVDTLPKRDDGSVDREKVKMQYRGTASIFLEEASTGHPPDENSDFESEAHTEVPSSDLKVFPQGLPEAERKRTVNHLPRADCGCPVIRVSGPGGILVKVKSTSLEAG